MELEQLLSLVTVIVSLVLGVLSKKSTFIKDELIPIQNIIVGLTVAFIYYIITKNVSLAIATSGIFAGGIYDIPNNLKKMGDD